jgi:hypothetical protein
MAILQGIEFQYKPEQVQYSIKHAWYSLYALGSLFHLRTISEIIVSLQRAV